MDCRQAQSQLDLGTLGQDAASGPDALAARRHLAECDVCRLAFQAQQGFDREVSRAMLDVPVPQGLVERLTAAVHAEAATSGASGGGVTGVRVASNPAVARPSPSRKWLSVGLVATLLICGSIWVAQSGPTLNENSVGILAKVDLNTLAVENQQLSLPKGWDALRDVQFGETARRAVVNGVDVPVQAFLLRMDPKSPATGILARIPLSRWQPAPDATSFPSATIQYAAFGSWVVWREGDAVFVCILQDNTRAMERLQDLIGGGRKFT